MSLDPVRFGSRILYVPVTDGSGGKEKGGGSAAGIPRAVLNDVLSSASNHNRVAVQAQWLKHAGHVQGHTAYMSPSAKPEGAPHGIRQDYVQLTLTSKNKLTGGQHPHTLPSTPDEEALEEHLLKLFRRFGLNTSPAPSTTLVAAALLPGTKVNVKA
jgi:hypothetical protein